MNPSPNWQALEKNICDTLKEWELKIGYSKEPVELYYPKESLCSLLGLAEEDLLKEALASFCKEVKGRLGELRISGSQKNYCIRIPEDGSRYVKDHIKAVRLGGLRYEQSQIVFQYLTDLALLAQRL